MNGLRRACVTLIALTAIAASAVACGGDASPAPLVNVGGTWTVVTIAGQPVGAVSPPQVQFTPDGHIVGSSFCNDFTGPVQISGNQITVGQLDHKQTNCPGPVIQLDTLFVTTLRSAERIAGGLGTGQLILSGPAGDIVFAQPGP